MSERAPREFQKKHGQCYACKRYGECTFLKTAHVPLYAWVCGVCRHDWVKE